MDTDLTDDRIVQTRQYGLGCGLPLFAFGMLGALVVTSVASAIELGFGSPDRTLIAMVIPGLVVLWVGAIAAWLAARPHA